MPEQLDPIQPGTVNRFRTIDQIVIQTPYDYVAKKVQPRIHARWKMHYVDANGMPVRTAEEDGEAPIPLSFAMEHPDFKTSYDAISDVGYGWKKRLLEMERLTAVQRAQDLARQAEQRRIEADYAAKQAEAAAAEAERLAQEAEAAAAAAQQETEPTPEPEEPEPAP